MTTERMIELLKEHIEVEKDWNIKEELFEALTGAVDVLSGKGITIPIDDTYKMKIIPCWEVEILDEHGVVRYENQYGEWEPLISTTTTKEKAEEEGTDLMEFYREEIKQ